MDVYIAKLRKYLKEDPASEIVNIHVNGCRPAWALQRAKNELCATLGQKVVDTFL